MGKEEQIKKELKKLLGKGVVEWAFTLETRNSALAGAIAGD